MRQIEVCHYLNSVPLFGTGSIYNPQIATTTKTISCSVLAIDIKISCSQIGKGTQINTDSGSENGSDSALDSGLTSESNKNRDENICTAMTLIGRGKHRRHHIRRALLLDSVPKHRMGNTDIAGDAGNRNDSDIYYYASERSLLQAFAQCLNTCDPDIITGWNVIDFDFRFLEQRFRALNIPWRLGRSQDNCAYRECTGRGSSSMFIPGRQVLDGMHLIRHGLTRFDNDALETVAARILKPRISALHSDHEGPPSTISNATTHAHAHIQFTDYFNDTQLALDILDAENLITLTINRATLTGLSLERAWGSVAAFEFLYMSALHQRHIVLRSINEIEDLNNGAPGGYVFQPHVGLHKHIFVFDFKSLYPSIIRTFNIDPLAHARAAHAEACDLLTAPNGATFTRQRSILPELLDVFFEKRAEAKAAHNELASYTYKIVMNSFYGVLGSNSCRLAHPELAGAITSFGHLLLKWCRSTLEHSCYDVLYGDTDSLFVDAHIPEDSSDATAHILAQNICATINSALKEFIQKEYRVHSQLELEFEKHYQKLFLPPSRGNEDIGRAKGYAGLIRHSNGSRIVDIVGLEAVRRDWTDLAHEFQRALFELLFHDSPIEILESFIQNSVRAIYNGQKDSDLIYKRALRKPIEAYTKTTPPHVKAARLLKNPHGLIHYIMTIHGPQPITAITAAIDYDHYVHKQILPIVTAITTVCDIDVHRAVYGEQRLF